MRNRLYVLIFIILFCGWQIANAQQDNEQQSAANDHSKGPTLDATIRFIEGALEQQGAFSSGSTGFSTSYELQSVKSPSQCSMEVINRIKFTFDNSPAANHEDTRRFILSLDQADPLSLSLIPDKLATPATYAVSIERAAVREKSINFSSSAVSPDLNGDYDIRGIVESIDPRMLIIDSDNGARISLAIAPNAKMGPGGSGKYVAARNILSNIGAGDYVVALKKRKYKICDITAVKNGTEKRRFVAAVFTDQEMAGRVAKAMIHALVLCQGQKSASPFKAAF